MKSGAPPLLAAGALIFHFLLWHLASSLRERSPARWTWPLAFLGVGASVVVVRGSAPDAFGQFGDAGYLPMVIGNGQPFSRWFLGSRFLIFVHDLAPGVDETTFVRFVGAAVMIIATLWIVKRSAGRLSFILPVVTPIWILLCTGYDEYYPFIAPISIVAVLHLLDEAEIENGWAVALLAGLMPLFYVGFLPLTLLMWLKALFSGVRAAVTTVAVSLLVQMVALQLIWHGGIDAFLTRLRIDANLGEHNTVFPAYRGRSLAHTPFFSPDYAFSFGHVSEMLRVLALGGGVFAVCGLVMFASRIIPVLRSRSLPRPSRKMVGRLTVAWASVSLFVTIPKLGPSRDTDLFFVVFIALAVDMGRRLDRSMVFDRAGEPLIRAFLVVSAVLNSLLVAATVFG